MSLNYIVFINVFDNFIDDFNDGKWYWHMQCYEKLDWICGMRSLVYSYMRIFFLLLSIPMLNDLLF